MILIADGSHWVSANIITLKSNGISGLLWKATDGATYVDPSYEQVRAQAQAFQFPFLALHYQENASNPASEVANIQRTISTDTPIVIDIEKNSGNVDHTRNLVQNLNAIGYHVPFVYIPQWYWTSIGSPSLAGLPPLWASHYIAATGDPRGMVSQVPISFWAGYGGNVSALLQFTDSGTIPGAGTIGDYSLFSGDTEQFIRFLNPNNFDYSGTQMTENILAKAGQNTHVSFTVAGYKTLRIPTGYKDVFSLLQFDYVFDTPVNQPDPAFVPGAGFNADPTGSGDTAKAWSVQPDRPGPWIIPAGATECSLRYSSDQDVYLGLSN